MTLLGPVYQVASPIIEQVGASQSQYVKHATEIATLKAEKQSIKKRLATYQHNSLERTGWLPAIQTASSRLKQVNQTLVELAGEQANHTQWLSQWVIWMEVIALILFQVVAVLAITYISRLNRLETGSGNMETQRKQAAIDQESAGFLASDAKGTESRFMPQETPSFCDKTESYQKKETMETSVETAETASGNAGKTAEIAVLHKMETPGTISDGTLALSQRMIAYLNKSGVTAKAFADACDVTPRDISFLRNHAARKKEGKRLIGKRSIEAIKQYLDRTSTNNEQELN